MKAIFIELPAFERHRPRYLGDDEFRALQTFLLKNPTVGDVIQGTGGLRKMRFSDPSRQKGKRGGVRIIYYWWISGSAFWLFTLYGKDEQDDLTPDQRKALKQLLDAEINART